MGGEHLNQRNTPFIIETGMIIETSMIIEARMIIETRMITNHPLSNECIFEITVTMETKKRNRSN